MLDMKPIDSLKESSELQHHYHQQHLANNLKVEGLKQVSNPLFLSTTESIGNQLEKEVTKPKGHPGRGEEEPPFMFAGIALSILGSLIGSVGILCVKLLPDTNFQQTLMTLLIRGVFIVFFCGLTCVIQGTSLKVKRDELLVNFLRAAFGTSAVLGTYCAMRYISLGDMTALVFSSPIWTSILGRIILKEPLQWIQLFVLPSSLLGIVLIAHPALIIDESKLLLTSSAPNVLSSSSSRTLSTKYDMTNNDPIILSNASNYSQTLKSHTSSSQFAESSSLEEQQVYEQRWLGILISLGTSFLISCTFIVLKFRKTTPIQTTTFWYGIVMVATSIILFTLCIDDVHVPDTLTEWTLYTMIGVCSWLGQCTLQWSFMYETAGVLALCKTLDVAMIFILSAIFLSDDILWTSILGASIISLSVAAMMFNSWLQTLPFMTSRQAKKAISSDDLESTLTISSFEVKEKSLSSIQQNREQIYYIQSLNESKKI